MHLPDPNAEIANKSQSRSLENLLVAKNRRLLDELTKLRVSWEELSALHAKSEDTVETLQNEVTRQRGLNEKLENDLMGIEKDGGRGTPVIAQGAAGLAGLDIGGKVVSRMSRGLRDSRLIFRKAAHRQPMETARSCPSSPASETASVNETPSSRRSARPGQPHDRANIQEMRRQFETISDLRAEIKSLQADNLKLYEKVRYMQSYKDSNTTFPPAGPSHSGGSAGMLNGVMRREDEIGKYKDKYEEHMNPFEAFKGRVSAKVFPTTGD